MRELIERLVKAGFAYVEQDHVLFEVGRMPDYGKLARRSLDEMEAGARVEVAPYKRNPMDFVLWKPSKPNEPGWPSPSGIKTPGRPGWHIECSAMSWKHLGETFDIHGGGIDLVFPHHENEIAQSRCAFHAPIMAKTWMHNGFLQVEGEKMSKSLGNFVTIRELLTDWKGRAWPGAVVRLAMLKTHYRQPLDWTFDRLIEANTEIGVLQNTVRTANPDKGSVLPDVVIARTLVWLGLFEDSYFEIGRAHSAGVKDAVEKAFRKVEDDLLASAGIERAEFERLVAERNAARNRKEWKVADDIRERLLKKGIALRDNKDGTTRPEPAQ